MAKIKPAGRKKSSTAGPSNPAAFGCIILLALIVIVVGVVLYFSFVSKP